jgi:hypothetical protein
MNIRSEYWYMDTKELVGLKQMCEAEMSHGSRSI